MEFKNHTKSQNFRIIYFYISTIEVKTTKKSLFYQILVFLCVIFITDI